MRPTWAEISRGALARNYQVLLRHAEERGAGLLCVVKADAYGHGIEACAAELLAQGARWFGVTGVEEGVRLRGMFREAGHENGHDEPRILVMGGVWKGEGEAALEHGLTCALWEPYQLDVLENAGRRMEMGAASVPVHLEVDSGMSRQGVPESQAVAIFERLRASPCVKMTGLATHFASGEVRTAAGEEQTRGQTSAFCRVALAGRHLDQYPQWLHAGNSATLATDTATVHRMAQLARGLGARLLIRPGLALYGCLLDEETNSGAVTSLIAAQLTPVMRWKTRITSLRHVAKGAFAGYNATWTAQRDSVLALLPVGYADGFRRSLSGGNHDGAAPRWNVMVRGVSAPVVGRVSMDLTIVDVTDVPGVAIGDEVELMRNAGEMARQMDTIAYEVTCGVGARVPRVVVV